MNKTLIGKNNYLFLINDTNRELEVHCNNLLLVNDITLSKYKNTNYILFIYPNKSLIYKKNLPDNYIVKYRPALDLYKNILGDKMIDLYDLLKDEEDIYYKTDTHINLKGNLLVYNYFINLINDKLDLNFKS